MSFGLIFVYLIGNSIVFKYNKQFVPKIGDWPAEEQLYRDTHIPVILRTRRGEKIKRCHTSVFCTVELAPCVALAAWLAAGILFLKYYKYEFCILIFLSM